MEAQKKTEIKTFISDSVCEFNETAVARNHRLGRFPGSEILGNGNNQEICQT